MEQRIGSKSQPLDAAAVNPAYIPGLTSPVPAEPKDAVEETEEGAAEGTVSDESAPGDAASDEAPAAETPKEPASEEESDSGTEQESRTEPESGADPDDPVFEASDRRASVTADHSGVRLRLDDQEAEFRWDEIGAVETESPRFGKRFTVTVHTPDRRWYPLEIEASARSRFKEWEEQLDAVLDAYFEDGDDAAEAEDATSAEVSEASEVSEELEVSGAAETSEASGATDASDASEASDSEAPASEASASDASGTKDKGEKP
ncbi:hypothetical protein OG788_28670 [Streptomyces sp. NBC_00647]|uniref:hypothetical protein n=1 Tax=Streptomyces sp. NBC_00647 TaxID=2975796 RepID=UPI0032521C16